MFFCTIFARAGGSVSHSTHCCSTGRGSCLIRQFERQARFAGDVLRAGAGQCSTGYETCLIRQFGKHCSF